MKFRNILKLLVIFTGLFLIAGAGFAEETKTPNVDNIEYQTGIIDRFAETEIVINDSLYKYAKTIQFLSRQGVKIETRWFKKGDKVKFVINNKNEAIIIKKT